MPDSTPPGESKEDRKKRLDRNRRRTHVLDDDAAKARAEDSKTVVELLAANPALIKRPVFVAPDGTTVVGFGKA